MQSEKLGRSVAVGRVDRENHTAVTFIVNSNLTLKVSQFDATLGVPIVLGCIVDRHLSPSTVWQETPSIVIFCLSISGWAGSLLADIWFNRIFCIVVKVRVDRLPTNVGLKSIVTKKSNNKKQTSRAPCFRDCRDDRNAQIKTTRPAAVLLKGERISNQNDLETFKKDTLPSRLSYRFLHDSLHMAQTW